MLIVSPTLKFTKLAHYEEKTELKNNILLTKKSSLDYVIKSLYGSRMVPVGFKLN